MSGPNNERILLIFQASLRATKQREDAAACAIMFLRFILHCVIITYDGANSVPEQTALL
jgi:hypothetical protein